MLFVRQTIGEGVHRLAQPGPLSARQHAAADDTGAGHSAPPDALLAHNARSRRASDGRRGHGAPELSLRDAKVRRQELPERRELRRHPRGPDGLARQVEGGEGRLPEVISRRRMRETSPIVESRENSRESVAAGGRESRRARDN